MGAQITENIAHDGIILCRAALGAPCMDARKSEIDTRYQQIETARRNGDAETIAQVVGITERFTPTASSFTIGALSSPENVRKLLHTIATGAVGGYIKAFLCDDAVCNLDQSWVRRQYAPSRYPPLHAPHGWHQDGALKFDFISHSNGQTPPGAMLEMITCWISLDSCGLDAPGLELVTERIETLLLPSELRTESVWTRFTPDKFWRPVLEPGDALLFRGDILHRTHVVPAMTKDRTSIELRFFSAERIPDRLKQDRFIPFG